MFIWFCVNRDNKVKMFLDEPVKNEKTGRYEGKSPYVNTLLYKDISEVVKQTKMTFDTEPQAIEIRVQQK